MSVIDPKPKWAKRRTITRFDKPVPCPYSCGYEANTSLQLTRHALTNHNWFNQSKSSPPDNEEQENATSNNQNLG